MVDLLLGIDGGGSKTRALIGDRSGAVLGTGIAPSSNYQSVGFATATASIDHAIFAALHAAGIESRQAFGAACFGLAGVDRPEDRRLWDQWLRERDFVQRWTIVNDAELVLAAGTPEGWGVALICGTGSIAYGRAPDGRSARAGGWGHLIGDEGSGYDIGIQALRLATQTADGRAEAHAMLAAILDQWQLSQATDLIGYVYRPEMTRGTIAQLAQRVMALAEGGDRPARKLVDHAAMELGRMVRAVATQIDLQSPPLALGGGLLGGSPLLQQALHETADIRLGPVRHVTDPAQGALVLARRLLEQTSA